MLKKKLKIKSGWLAVICFAGIILYGSCAWARIIYVDGNAETGGDGTSATPYRTIQEAVDNAVNLDVVNVRAGTYEEDVTVNGKGIELIGADPKTTILKGNSTAIKLTGTFASGENVVKISGFTITNASTNGVYSNSSSVIAYIQNNIISYNQYGVRLSAVTTFVVSNNVIVHNPNRGIIVDASYAKIKMHNNIFGSNGKAFDDNTNFSREAYVYAYNNNWNGDSTEGTIDYSSENINLGAQFIDEGTGDYRLLAASPCIDAGRKTTADNDPDGTRNDMGVYGGPGAAAFWPETAGGPVVTELSVTPASVSSSGTITIKAKAVIP